MTLSLLLLYVGLLVVAGVMTALKGKWFVVVAGLAFSPAWVLGALRLAKPDSWWARRYYSQEKRARAREELPRRVRVARLAAVGSIVPLALAFAALKLYRIPTSAMEPSLHCGSPALGCLGSTHDRVLGVRLLGFAPRRGDVIAFRVPDEGAVDCGLPPDATLIKRVVGLPDERIQVRGGDVFVDGRRLTEPYVRPERRSADTYPRRQLRAGEYYVLGDNRTQSCDSRVWGKLDGDRIVARVVARYWPPGRAGLL